MKSEHRHELQTNDLSKLTQKGVRFVEEHAMKITIVICVITVAIAGYRIYATQAASTSANAWYDFSTARSPDDFATIAENDRVKGTVAADWAILLGAEGRLSQAIQGMFTDRANAVTELTAARDNFQKLVDNRDKMIKQRAIFGLGRAEESLGNLEAARAAYSELGGDEFKDSVYHKMSQERAEYLAKSGPQAFYAWFEKQNPKPAEPPKPDSGSGLPGGNILDSGDLPFGGGPNSLENPLRGLPNLDDSDNEGPADTDAKPDAEAKPDTTADDAAETPADKPDAPADDAAEAPAEPVETPAEPSEPATEADTDGAADNTDDAK